ncbi:MAG TPA: hypothetical protein VF855_00565, partial [Acidimicrobiales bacterium]
MTNERFTPPTGLPDGVTIVGMTGDGRRVSAALASGEVAARPIEAEVVERLALGTTPLGFAAGTNAVFNNGLAIVVPVDVDEPVRFISPACGVFGPATAGMWLVMCPSFSADPASVRTAAVDEREPGVWKELPPGAIPVGVDDDGHLLVEAPAGYFLLSEGALDWQLLTRNILIAVGRDRMVEYACDDRLSCRVQVVDRATGTARPVDV